MRTRQAAQGISLITAVIHECVVRYRGWLVQSQYGGSALPLVRDVLEDPTWVVCPLRAALVPCHVRFSTLHSF